MITINANAQPYMGLFTRIGDHHIESYSDEDYPASDVTEVISDVRRRIAMYAGGLREVVNREINRSHIFDLLSPLPFQCPECSDLITSVDYASNVREYGSATIGFEGVDDYDCNDSETQDTSYSCNNCGEEIHDIDSLPVLCPRECITAINDFLAQVMAGDYGPAQLGPVAPPSTWRPRPVAAYPSHTISVSGTNNQGIGTDCEAALPIATEDIHVDDSLFDN